MTEWVLWVALGTSAWMPTIVPPATYATPEACVREAATRQQIDHESNREYRRITRRQRPAMRYRCLPLGQEPK